MPAETMLKATPHSLRPRTAGMCGCRGHTMRTSIWRVWVERIAAQPLACTYVYFMHEDEALGTRFAQRLNELWCAMSEK
jgi:hypothetical protein